MTDNRKFDPQLWTAALITLALATAMPLTAGAQTASTPFAAPATGADFSLNRESHTQELNYPEARDLRICNRTDTAPGPADEASVRQPLSDGTSRTHPAQSFDLQVAYNDTSTQLAPEQCVEMNTANVRITAVEPLGSDDSLDGRIDYVGPYGPETGETLEETHEDLVAMREDLARQDREMQEANAELQRARDDLNDATRKLEETHQASSDDTTVPR
jgi:hypothetical protein